MNNTILQNLQILTQLADRTACPQMKKFSAVNININVLCTESKLPHNTDELLKALQYLPVLVVSEALPVTSRHQGQIHRGESDPTDKNPKSS